MATSSVRPRPGLSRILANLLLPLGVRLLSAATPPPGGDAAPPRLSIAALGPPRAGSLISRGRDKSNGYGVLALPFAAVTQGSSRRRNLHAPSPVLAALAGRHACSEDGRLQRLLLRQERQLYLACSARLRSARLRVFVMVCGHYSKLKDCNR